MPSLARASRSPPITSRSRTPPSSSVLPKPVGPGESVTVDLDYSMTLPNKQGRWGHWDGVSFLNEWLPTLAYLRRGRLAADAVHPLAPAVLQRGRHLHRPHRHAGRAEGRLLGPGAIRSRRAATAGPWSKPPPVPLRDFTLLSSARYQEHAVAVRRRHDQMPRPAGARLVRPGDGPHRGRGDPRLQPAVRAVPVQAFHRRRELLRLERQRVRRPGHDRPPRLRHAAPGQGLRRLPGLARDPAPVVVQRRRHQRLPRDLDGRRAWRPTSRTAS